MPEVGKTETVDELKSDHVDLPESQKYGYRLVGFQGFGNERIELWRSLRKLDNTTAIQLMSMGGEGGTRGMMPPFSSPLTE